MKCRPSGSNINLLAAYGLACLWAVGCRSSPESEKEATTLRFHLEANRDSTGLQSEVRIGRSVSFPLVVQEQPFLTELFVIEADVVEVVGGFEIELQLDRQGTWLLEQYTTAHKGRHFAIFSQFGEARWLAAPLATRSISDGKYRFTPDASREEANRIVRGLQSIAGEVRKHNGR